MPDDAYRPPEAEITASAGSLAERRGTGTFTIGEALTEAWNATWAHFPLWLGVGFVWVIGVLLSYLTVLGVIFVLPVLQWGAAVFALHMLRGGARFGDVFSGFSRYGATLGPMLGLTVIFLVLSLLSNAVSYLGQYVESAALQFLGSLISIVVGLLVIPRLTFSWFYCVDQGESAMSALERSWQATQNLKLRVLGLVLVAGILVLIGALLLVLPAIPASVVAYLMIASAYRQMEGDPQAAS